MPSGNSYVVDSLDPVNSAQREHKSISFAPFAAIFQKRICRIGAATGQIMERNLPGKEGLWGFFTDTHKAMHHSLAPGPDLDDLVASMIRHASRAIDALLDKDDEIEIDLYDWIRDMVTLASTDAI